MKKDKSKEKDKRDQLVYILTNRSMPGLIKIGHTIDLKSRLNVLSSKTGVPTRFECHCCCVVKDMKDIEKRLHYALSDFRREKREFFEFDADKVQKLLIGYARKVLIRDGEDNFTSKKKNNSVKGSSRSTKFYFSMVNIKNGARLTFIKDETKIATVIDAEKGKIMFDGEPGTLSGFAQSILNKKALQGAKYWKYKGEILTDLREKMENKNK